MAIVAPDINENGVRSTQSGWHKSGETGFTTDDLSTTEDRAGMTQTVFGGDQRPYTSMWIARIVKTTS
jgi:hypothetical protein